MLSTAKIQLVDDLQNIMKSGIEEMPPEVENSINSKAQLLADAIDDYVHAIQITILSGEIITAGTPTAQSNLNPLILSGPTHIQ